MTRLAIIADPHVANHKRWGGQLVGGLNDRGRQCVAVLKRCYDTALKEGCDALYILGDLFHNTKPSPPLVRAVADALRGPMTTYVILGNHDKQSEIENDHAAASLNDALVVIDKPTLVPAHGDLDVWAIPYTAGEAKDWLTAGMAACAERQRLHGQQTVVLTHLGIFDDDTPSYLKTAHDAVSIGFVRWLCEEVHAKSRVGEFLAGNWHLRREWHAPDLSVVIPGTICPASFSDLDPAAGNMTFVDSSTHPTVARSIPGPRFFKMNLAQFEDSHWRASAESGWAYYYHVAVSREELPRALELAKEVGEGRFVHVELDEEQTRATVKQAARAASLAGQGNASLAAEHLADVKEPGTPEGVARRFEAYRKAAL